MNEIGFRKDFLFQSLGLEGEKEYTGIAFSNIFQVKFQVVSENDKNFIFYLLRKMASTH